nr:helix-turn-helix transcriptional regulator [uncultured Oscillibacter sp.]
MTYGERIKQARERRGLTQEQLAESLEVSRQAVSKWEMDLSRPARGKLARLSEVLELPEETWAAMDEEAAAAERPGDAARPWRIAAAVLAALCLVLGAALAAVLRHQAHPGVPAPVEETQDGPAAAETGIPDLTEAFPETLPLGVTHDFDFGDVPTGDYAPACVPFLEDDLELQEQEVWGGYLGDEGDTRLPTLHLSVVKTNPVEENRTTFYDLYLLYAQPDSAGDLNWKILTRIADCNHYVNTDGFQAERFANVLGRDGWKLSIVIGASAGDMDYYITQRPDGSPALMAVGNKAQEFDVDEDGELEIVSLCGHNPWYCEITDTREGEEGAFRYTLDPYNDGFANVGLGFDADKGGFVATDSQESVLARYLLGDGELVRQPLTDFTAADWPDVAGTKLTFVTEAGLSDGRGPDEVLYGKKYRITHRQQAYLALQELYNLTGLRVEACCYSASETGVHFSLLPDGTNGRNFFSAWYGEDYGGSGIPSLHVTWRELGNDWSPLSLAEAARPESWVARENTLRWYYDRLAAFRTGEAAIETDGEFPEERYLYLENGDLFVGDFRDTDQGMALVSLIGPYPGGEVNH